MADFPVHRLGKLPYSEWSASDRYDWPDEAQAAYIQEAVGPVYGVGPWEDNSHTPVQLTRAGYYRSWLTSHLHWVLWNQTQHRLWYGGELYEPAQARIAGVVSLGVATDASVIVDRLGQYKQEQWLEQCRVRLTGRRRMAHTPYRLFEVTP